MIELIHLSVECHGGFTVYPGNTGCEVGIYFEWEASPSQDTTHIYIGEELVDPEDMQTWGEVTRAQD